MVRYSFSPPEIIVPIKCNCLYESIRAVLDYSISSLPFYFCKICNKRFTEEEVKQMEKKLNEDKKLFRFQQ